MKTLIIALLLFSATVARAQSADTLKKTLPAKYANILLDIESRRILAMKKSDEVTERNISAEKLAWIQKIKTYHKIDSTYELIGMIDRKTLLFIKRKN